VIAALGLIPTVDVEHAPSARTTGAGHFCSEQLKNALCGALHGKAYYEIAPRRCV
jgi:hypothetical protein